MPARSLPELVRTVIARAFLQVVADLSQGIASPLPSASQLLRRGTTALRTSNNVARSLRPGLQPLMAAR